MTFCFRIFLGETMGRSCILKTSPMLLLGSAALTVSSCSDGDIRSSAPESAVGDFTQSQADAISEKCGAPKRWLLVTNGTLTMKPDPDMDYDVGACLITEIRATGLSKFGFVGNEQLRDTDAR